MKATDFCFILKLKYYSFAVEETVCKRRKVYNELCAKANGNVCYYFNESKMWLLRKIGILKDKSVESPQINTSGTALSERQRSQTNFNQSLITTSGITDTSSNSASSFLDDCFFTSNEENTDDSFFNSSFQSSVRTKYEKFNNTKESFFQSYSKCNNVGKDEFSNSSSKVNLSPRYAPKNKCASNIVGTSFSVFQDMSDDEDDLEMYVQTEKPPVCDGQIEKFHDFVNSGESASPETKVIEESQYFSCEESSEHEISKEPNQDEKSLLKAASNGDALSNFDFPPEKPTGRLLSLFNDTLSNTLSSKIGELRNDLSRIFVNLFKRHDTLKTVSNGSLGSFSARPFPRFQVLSIKAYDYRELTAEEAQVVKGAWQEKDSDKILSSGFGIDIRPKDLKTLAGGNWLNDEVINFYFNLIVERSKKNCSLPSVYVFNTFFCLKLSRSGFDGVKRWTRNVNIFNHDFLFIPVHSSAHWTLATIDFRKKTVLHYDSLGGSNVTLLNSLKEYLCQESKAKGHDLHIDQWTFSHAEGVPRQGNFNDCGVFVCKFADFLSRDAELSFNQSHMANFRLRMAYEILNKQLLC
ncbi:Sentrin-specific protease 1 [Trichinella zimbabwensis]|uniref:Sentrin-specific protease 1 n=1 Tax=Trichinella zimbabwensis TaxID=268475 RepID=A0A0V1I3M4_9BILA|nr:Sentrin-specific protease 1 [Trichinella zimbabwensis]